MPEYYWPSFEHRTRCCISRFSPMGWVSLTSVHGSKMRRRQHAEAICEAMSRPSMRFVAIKTVEQQDIQATHRIRSGLIEQRTAKANQIRGLVSEYGLVAPKELLSLRRAIPCRLEDAENGLTLRFRLIVESAIFARCYVKSESGSLCRKQGFQSQARTFLSRKSRRTFSTESTRSGRSHRAMIGQNNSMVMGSKGACHSIAGGVGGATMQ